MFVVDGDAPPERFDHVHTLIGMETRWSSAPNLLTKNGLDPRENEGQISALVGHRSARLPSPISSFGTTTMGRKVWDFVEDSDNFSTFTNSVRVSE